MIASRSTVCLHTVKTLRRHQSTHTRPDKSPLLELYESEGKFRSSKDLAASLANNVVYFDPENDKSGLVVVNKPARVPMKPCDTSSASMEEAMPDLAQMLGLQHLSVIKAAGRPASGCVLLASSNKTEAAVKKSFRRSLHDKKLDESFLAITVGIPMKAASCETVDVVLERIGDETNRVAGKKRVEPVISRALPKNMDKLKMESNARRISVFAGILARANGGRASLYEIQPSATQNNFNQVYSADMLSPVLGDHFYGYRVSTAMGRPVRVSCQRSPDTRAPVQVCPPWMLEKLGISRGREHILPLHLHLGRINLPHFLGRGKDLSVYAMPRPFFYGTAEALGITMPQSLYAHDEVRTYSPIYPRQKKVPPVTVLEEDEQISGN